MDARTSSSSASARRGRATTTSTRSTCGWTRAASRARSCGAGSPTASTTSGASRSRTPRSSPTAPRSTCVASGSSGSPTTTARPPARAGSSRGCGSARRSGCRGKSSSPSGRCSRRVRYAVDAYVDFARRKPWIEAVASSLTELFGPSAIRVRLASLEAHYPWIDPAGLEYFRDRLVQAPRDAEYALRLVVERCVTREQQERAVAALRFKTEMLWAQLEAIEHGDTHAGGAGVRAGPGSPTELGCTYDDVREEHLLLDPGGRRAAERDRGPGARAVRRRALDGGDRHRALGALLRRGRHRRRARAARRPGASEGWWSMPPPSAATRSSPSSPTGARCTARTARTRSRSAATAARDELETEHWTRVFREARRARRAPARADRR